ncbi:similar to Saccharomyces cerevisiae YHR058C MED6 Subunit of the RNA polymerase II mediator complex [Maudiozyma saulgeensis]|uniref:Mediator of RNA polymerase II transcription subunit 6 n=1 Tax=Maudiozyma saulgeensis TaxID=1789683 RepID=A0A1X7QZ31_9SACH|nr:similar to Saccharomyces cerevisiae YHR058C MED6 Subunit of the RNA polymerase II mediator complex [Kazachstania saulgeensis]
MNTPLDELQWKSPEWIQAFGLRTENVLDYFSESPFFDKTSNNHVIKMQRQFSQMPGEAPPQTNGKQENENGSQENNGNNSQFNSSLLPQHDFSQAQNEFSHVEPSRRDVLTKYPMYAALERELSKLKGVEYVLACVREPDFWIIKKQNRLSSNQTDVLQDYYVIGANVYQAPTMFKVIQNRLMSTNYHLSQTIKNLHKLTQFQPSHGMQFKSTASLSSQTVMPNGSTVTSVPATAATTTTTGTFSTATTMNTAAQTANSAQYDNSRSRDMITKDMMDKLMITSIKSKPEYIQ